MRPDQQSRIFDLARHMERNPARQVIMSTDRDKALLRHSPTAPDFTPIPHRDCPPGHLLVEWIGERGPRANEQIFAAIQMLMLPPKIVAMIDEYHRVMGTRIDGVVGRTVGDLDDDGLSRVYSFGPKRGTYVQPMRYMDADHLFGTPCAHEFRYFENGVTVDFDLDYIERCLPPALRDKVRAIQVKIGPEEKLKGIAINNARMGYWSP